METNIQIKAIIERTKVHLTDFYNGNNWVTENFQTRVLALKADEALQKVQWHSHSVAELVGHMTAWRNFGLQKLKGNDTYDIEDDSTVNWPQLNDWNIICKEFKSCHQDLLSAIENFPPDRWDEKVPGRNYSFIFLITGIIHHDYYHYGQIGSVLAAIKKAQSAV